jgi:hypothetical protein
MINAKVQLRSTRKMLFGSPSNCLICRYAEGVAMTANAMKKNPIISFHKMWSGFATPGITVRTNFLAKVITRTALAFILSEGQILPSHETSLNPGVILKVAGIGDTVDDRLKELMQELGNAINESLSDSERIAEAIGEIKKAGYDVFLVLEATIGFNKREEGAEPEAGESDDLPADFESAAKLKWTSQDHKFLRALKIAIDEEK